MSIYQDKPTKEIPNGRTFDWINEISDSDKAQENYSPNDKKTSSRQKYFVTAIFFTIGLALVSIVKNETRELQAEINKLLINKSNLELELYRANLDHDVITSPKNISSLANEYLDKNFNSYKKSQIKNLNKKFTYSEIIKMEENKNEKKKNFLGPQKFYSGLKVKIEKEIDTAKTEIKEIYEDPKSAIQSKKKQKWALFQVAKVFFGIPVVPGR
jgi:light-regulated signal transduction histidine kinase (bacteriophytochrome)